VSCFLGLRVFRLLEFELLFATGPDDIWFCCIWEGIPVDNPAAAAAAAKCGGRPRDSCGSWESSAALELLAAEAPLSDPPDVECCSRSEEGSGGSCAGGVVFALLLLIDSVSLTSRSRSKWTSRLKSCGN